MLSNAAADCARFAGRVPPRICMGKCSVQVVRMRSKEAEVCVNLNAPFSSETIRRDCRCVNDRPWKWVLVFISRFVSFSCPREVCRNRKSSCVIYVSDSETVCPLSCKLFVAAVCYCNQTTLPHNRQMCVLPWCFNGHEHLTCEAGCAVRVSAETTCMEMCS